MPIKKIVASLSIFGLTLPSFLFLRVITVDAATLQENIESIVYIECGYYDLDNEPVVYAGGSGVALDDGLVLTNTHVAFDAYIYEDYDEYYGYEYACLEPAAGSISCGQTVTGDNTAGTFELNDYITGSIMDGPEDVYTFELPEESDVTFTLDNVNNEADLGFMVMKADTENMGLACAEQTVLDGDWELGGETEEQTATFGEGTYYISVDGWFEEDYGEYELSVSCDEPTDIATHESWYDDTYDDWSADWEYYDDTTYYEVYEYDFCIGGIAPNAYTSPEMDIVLETEIWNLTNNYDYAFMNAYTEDGYEYDFDRAVTYGNPDSLVHGDALDLIGYPGVLESSVTTTTGTVSGFDGTDWIISDAIAEFGNSGGGAFDVNGNLIGIPTEVVSGYLNSYSYIQNLNAILEDALGTEVIYRDYETIYTTENLVCFDTGECYQYGEGVDDFDYGDELEAEEHNPDVQGVDNYGYEKGFYQNGNGDMESGPGAYNEENYDADLVERLTGYVLLQTDEYGEAWYVNPTDLNRYYMADGTIAYEMMRSFGLGITDADLASIPSVDDVMTVDDQTGVCASNATANRLAGRILLQVEQHGEAWYVDPDTCYRLYMADGDAAYDIMRYLSLGISNNDLTKLPSSSL